MREQWEIRWKDYYEILQVHPKATPAVIGKAYRTLASVHHADVGGSDTAMAALNEAYEILSDPARRGHYDAAYSRRGAGWSERITRPARSSPEDTVEACLKTAGLKFLRIGDTFVLPFSMNATRDTAVQLSVVEDLAVIATPLPQVKASDRRALHNLLRATHALDTYKLCCDKDNGFLMVAEIPHSLATAEILERFIRGCVKLADAHVSTYRSFAQVQRVVKPVQTRTAFGVLLGFLMDDTGSGPSARSLPRICRAHRLTCRRLGERDFVVQLRSLPFPIHALCRGASISMILPTGLKPKSSHAGFYTSLSRLNLKMNICKVALDSDDEVAFLYELPSLDETVFLKAVDRIESYLLGGGLEIVMAMKRSEKKRGFRRLFGR